MIYLEDKIPIRIDFKDEDARKFLAVKQWKGLKQNTELLRVLIADAYTQMIEMIEMEARQAKKGTGTLRRSVR